MFWLTCAARRIPGMTVETSGCARMNRSAAYGIDEPAGISGTSAST